MMCFGRISEQEIRDALSETKDAFCTSITVAEKPEQCVKALKIAVDTLTRVQKDGKRALNKAQNFDLKEEVAGVYRELTQLQDYSGPDKVQKCIKLATKLSGQPANSIRSNLVSTGTPNQTPPVGGVQSPVTGSGQYANNNTSTLGLDNAGTADQTHPVESTQLPAVKSGEFADRTSISGEDNSRTEDQAHPVEKTPTSGEDNLGTPNTADQAPQVEDAQLSDLENEEPVDNASKPEKDNLSTPNTPGQELPVEDAQLSDLESGEPADNASTVGDDSTPYVKEPNKDGSNDSNVEGSGDDDAGDSDNEGSVKSNPDAQRVDWDASDNESAQSDSGAAYQKQLPDVAQSSMASKSTGQKSHIMHKTEVVLTETTVNEPIPGAATDPAVPKGTSWFRRRLASGPLQKVDGVWKRTVSVVTTRKAHVDEKCPIAKTSFVYYDEDVYDVELIEASTGTNYISQLLYDGETEVYYVYNRYGETDYMLDGPHETIEEAKVVFKDNFKKRTEIEWEERETAFSDKWTLDVKTYETYETVEEVVEEAEAEERQSQNNDVDMSRTRASVKHSKGGSVITLDSVVLTCAYSPDGESFTVGLENGYVDVYRISDWERTQTLRGHADAVKCVVYSPKGDRIASASQDLTVKLWDPRTGSMLHTLTDHGDYVNCVAYSPQRDQVASASEDRTVRIWDTITGECHHVFSGHSDGVSCVAYSSHGDMIVSGSEDKTVRLWDVATGTCRMILEGHIDQVSGIACSPESDQLATASLDGTLRIWDVATGACLHVFTGHTKGVLCVAYSPGGDDIVSGSIDNTVKLWDATSGSLNGTFTGYSRPVTSVVYSPDGGQIASSSYDMTVRLQSRDENNYESDDDMGFGLFDDDDTQDIKYIKEVQSGQTASGRNDKDDDSDDQGWDLIPGISGR